MQEAVGCIQSYSNNRGCKSRETPSSLLSVQLVVSYVCITRSNVVFGKYDKGVGRQVVLVVRGVLKRASIVGAYSRRAFLFKV